MTLEMIETAASFGPPTLRQDFTRRVMAIVQRYTRAMAVDLGLVLIEARDKLPHGAFTQWIEDDLPFGPDQAQRLMRLARDPRISNPDHDQHLPADPIALDTLRLLSDGDFAAGVSSGEIHPKMGREDAQALAARKPQSPPRPPMHITARAQEMLSMPIRTWAEFLATLKGYREAQDPRPSQLAMDHRIGLTGGHAGKIEIDTRRPGPEIFDALLPAYGLSLIAVPTVNTLRLDLCPCCRQPVKP